MELVQRFARRIEMFLGALPSFRKCCWRMRGARIGPGTRLPRVLVTWPHQVAIGSNCVLQPDIFFNYDHFWTPGPSIIVGNRVFVGRGVEFNIRERIEVGDDSLIASGCTFVDHDHGTAAGMMMNAQPAESCPIAVGRGAWIGANCVVLKGAQIGEGAVIGAGSVVTKAVPPFEIWCGVPARRIGKRGAAE